MEPVMYSTHALQALQAMPDFLILELGEPLTRLRQELQEETDSNETNDEIRNGYVAEILEYLGSEFDAHQNILEYTQELQDVFQINPRITEAVYDVSQALYHQLNQIKVYDVSGFSNYTFGKMLDENTVILTRIEPDTFFSRADT